MAGYINEDIKRQIESVSILDYAKVKGFELEKTGKEYKVPGYGGLYIREDGKVWNCFSQKKGGGIAQFCQFITGKEWFESMHDIADTMKIDINNRENKSTPNSKTKKEKNQDEKIFKINELEEKEITKEEKKEFVLPEKAANNKNLFAYLNKTRGIDNDIIKKFVEEGKIYQEKKFNSIIFKVSDEQGNDIGSQWHSTLTNKSSMGFKKRSKLEYPFFIGGKGSDLYIFESPIDLMSYLSLAKLKGQFEQLKENHFIATWSINNDELIDKYLQQNPQLDGIVICYDNDTKADKNYGQEKAQELMEKYSHKFYFTIDVPGEKDFNDDLKLWIKKNITKETPEKDLATSNISESIEEQNMNPNYEDGEKKHIENLAESDEFENVQEKISTIEFENIQEKISTMEQTIRKFTTTSEKHIYNLNSDITSLKKSIDSSISAIINSKNEEIERQKIAFEKIIQDSAKVMIENGIEINIISDITKVNVSKLEEIRQNVNNYTGRSDNGISVQKEYEIKDLNPYNIEKVYPEDELLMEVVLEKA